MKQQNPLKKKKLTKLERRRAGHGSKTMTTECTSINAVNYSKLQVLRRIQKHARRLIIPRNCTDWSELSWTREREEADTQWTARHARFRTTLSGDTSRKTAHRSTSKSPLHAAARIDQLLRKFQPQNKKYQKYHAQAFLLQHLTDERNKLEVPTLNLT